VQIWALVANGRLTFRVSVLSGMICHHCKDAEGLMSNRRNIVLILAAGLATGVASAGEHPSQDEILAAVRRGEMRPLSEIEALVKDSLPGAVIKTEIERKREGWIYEFKTLDAAGRRSDVNVDAVTGRILKVERK
jgi:uncharacterized membrane protein YkoI